MFVNLSQLKRLLQKPSLFIKLTVVNYTSKSIIQDRDRLPLLLLYSSLSHSDFLLVLRFLLRVTFLVLLLHFLHPLLILPLFHNTLLFFLAFLALIRFLGIPLSLIDLLSDRQFRFFNLLLLLSLPFLFLLGSLIELLDQMHDFVEVFHRFPSEILRVGEVLPLDQILIALPSRSLNSHTITFSSMRSTS